MKMFDLVWIMTRGGPLWSTETVSTYVYKRAFEWNTFDLGYPSAIAVVWFVVVIVFVLALTWAFRQRDRLRVLSGDEPASRPGRARSCWSPLSLYTAYAAGPFLWIAGDVGAHHARDLRRSLRPAVDRRTGTSTRRPGSNRATASISITALIVVVAAVAIVTIVGAMAAHCLARYRFRGNRLIYFLIFSAIVFPPQITIIALFQILVRLRAVQQPRRAEARLRRRSSCR